MQMNSMGIPTIEKTTVIFIGFFSLALAFSARAVLGMMMPILQNDLGWTYSYISSVGAVALIVMAVTAPFAGRFVDKKGPRVTLALGLLFIAVGCAIITFTDNKILFALAFSGFCGIGFGIVATHTVAAAVARIFKENQGLATGMACSGSTGGQFLIIPLVATLITVASWRYSFAGLAISCVVLSLFIYLIRFSSEANNGANTTAHEDVSTVRQDLEFVVRKPVFHALFWSFLICGFTTTGVIETHLLPYAALCGFPPIASATAYGLLSAVNLGGMLLAGFLADRLRNRGLLLASIYFIRAICFLLLANLTTLPIEMLFVFAIAFGAVDYSTVPVTASLVAQHIGIRFMGLSMGLIAAGHAVGGAMGAFFGGYTFDLIGNYNIVWMSSLWLAIGAGVIALAIPREVRKVELVQ